MKKKMFKSIAIALLFSMVLESFGSVPVMAADSMIPSKGIEQTMDQDRVVVTYDNYKEFTPEDIDPNVDDVDPEYFKYVEGITNEGFYDEDGVMMDASSFKTTSPFKNSTYTHNGQFSGVKIKNMIDVSQWQGKIDWKKAKADGVEYAIIRVCGRYSGSGGMFIDDNYITNIKNANAAGVKVGVYVYSQAISKAEGEEEAKYILNKISPYKSMISLPVVLDYEYYGSGSGRLYNAHLSKSAATNVCLAFCDYVAKQGYTPMVYANKSMLTAQMNAADIYKKYDIWVAQYNSSCTFDGKYTAWQYTSTGSVDGIGGSVDCNFWYGNTVPATAVKLENSKVYLSVGESTTNKATMTPNTATDVISWSSSNPHVAYVTSIGTIKAIGIGSTTITATASSGVRGSCTVYVQGNLDDFMVESVDDSDCTYTGYVVLPSAVVKSKEPVYSRGVIMVDAVSMFTGPSKSSYPLIAIFEKGDEVTVYGETVDYYSVTGLKDGVTYSGYIAKSAFNIPEEPTVDPEENNDEIISDDITNIKGNVGEEVLVEGKAIYKAIKYLEPKSDYIIDGNGINCGTQIASISTGANQYYKSSIDFEYIISKRNVEESKMDKLPSYLATGDEIEPEISLTYNEMALQKDIDYTVEFKNNVDGGYADILIYGIGNYDGIKQEKFVIANSMIKEILIDESLYSGEEIKPEVTILLDNGEVLSSDKYILTFADNIDVGKATLEITFVDEKMQPNLTLFFEIKPKNVEDMECEDIEPVEFNGLMMEPAIYLFDGEKRLIEGMDYTVVYSDNSKPGMATATITGIGNYCGSIVKNFEIKGRMVEDLTVSSISAQTYTGSAIKPSVTVKDGNITLKKDVDYTLSYSNNTKCGKATVKITGKGSYLGSKTVNFVIKPKAVSGFKYTAASTTSIKLSWSKNAGSPTGYEIYYATCYDGTYKLLKTVTSASTVSYTHTKRTKSREYYYKIRSYVTVDGKKYYSSFSSRTTTRPKVTTSKKKTTAGVNMRAHAGTSFSKKVLIPKGKTVTVYAYTADKSGKKWYRVTYKTSKKTYTGYVLGTYIK